MSVNLLDVDTPPVPCPNEADVWYMKRTILIRHGRSSWNEFLGAHKKNEWAERERERDKEREDAKAKSRIGGALRGVFRSGYGGGSSAAGGGAEPKGLLQGVRSAGRHVANAWSHADKLQQVDHALSIGGLNQARALKKRVTLLVAAPPDGLAAVGGGGTSCGAAAASFLQCRDWYVSPYLRALQTASFVLTPLMKRDPSLRILVTPEANEIITSKMGLDCQGKHGNIGHRIIARAIARTAEIVEEEEDDLENHTITRDRLCEIADVSATLAAMDLREVYSVWWKDVKDFKKEHSRLEDIRIRRLVALMLREPAASTGVVAHSLLFQRLLQIFWPHDPLVQEAVRASLRNGAPPADTRDALHDKIMNCGTLVLTWRYCERATNPEGAPDGTAEIVAAEFLFEGHMESGLSVEHQSFEDELDVGAEGGTESSMTLGGDYRTPSPRPGDDFPDFLN